MKLKYRRYFATLSAGAFLATAAPHANAQSQVVILPTQVVTSGNDFSFFFSPVTSANDLISISSGASVQTGEGGSLTISAISGDGVGAAVTDQYFQIFSSSNTGFFTTTPLATITSNNYTAFATPLTIKGLRVVSFGIGSGNAPPAVLTLPQGTTLTFSVIPEPQIAVMLMGALMMMSTFRFGHFRRRIQGA